MDTDRAQVFITGNSSGLGRGLTEACLDRGWRVYGCSRRGCELGGDLANVRVDLSRFDAVPTALTQLLDGVERLDLVILNAGAVGEIRDLTRTPLEDIQRIMDINTWSNKIVMDWLHGSGITIDQIVMISSGAAVLGNRGWGGYALSKAALNMLARLYSHEFPDTHITAVAPGLVDTAMMDYLCAVHAEQFPALSRIRKARGTGAMPAPRTAAEQLIEALAQLKATPSGSYVDIRSLVAPEEYAELMGHAPRGDGSSAT